MMKQSIKNLIFMVILVSISSVLSSCTNSGNGSSGTLNTTQSSDLKIDKSSSIPVLDGNPTTTGIYIHNTTNHAISGISYQVLNSSASSHLTINQSSCTTIKANSSCLLSITTPSVKPLNGGGDVIIANYNGTQSSQMINYNYVDSSSYNGVSFANANVELIGRRDYATVYAFVGSNQSATNVSFKSSNNSVGVVNGLTNGGTSIGSNQVLPLEIVSSDNITATNVSIMPISDSTQSSKSNQHIQNANNNRLQVAIVPTATSPNLIMSNVGLLTQANPEVTVTVYNSGNSTANNINLYSQTSDIAVSDGANLCSNNIIPSGSRCDYILSLDTTTNSGSATLTLAYNGTPKQMTVYYQNAVGAPMVGIAPATSQLTVGTSSTESFVFNVRNYGIRALNNPVITPISQVTGTTLTETSNDCGNEINPNETCSIITSIVAGSSINSGMMYLNISGVDSNNSTYSFMSLPVSVTLTDLPPKLVSTTPSNTESNVSQATGITLNFNEPMDPLTLSASNIQLLLESDDVAIALTSQGVTNNNQTVSFNQSNGHLDEFTSYKIVINPSAITDSTGLAMDSGVTESIVAVFTTGDSIAPTITDFVPSNGAESLSRTPTMSIQFSESMDSSTLTTSSIRLVNSSNVQFANYTINYDPATYTATLVLTGSATLASQTTYRIILNQTLIKDNDGNALGLSSSDTLTTFTIGDYTAPTVSSVSPVNGTEASVSTNISIIFSEAMDTSTLTNTNIKLYQNRTGSEIILINPVYSNGDRTVTLTPNTMLSANESYNVIINPSGIKDAVGNIMSSATSLKISTFTAILIAPGLILSSTNGLIFYDSESNTLTLESSSPSNSHTTVVFGNGLFIAGGQPQSLYYSADGLNWNLANWGESVLSNTVGNTTTSFAGSVYANNKFVMVGRYIMYSTDGMTWNYANPNPLLDLKSVIYDGSQFIAVGSSLDRTSGVIITSTDGITWSTIESSSTHDFEDIIYNAVNGMYIAICTSTNPAITSYYIASAASLTDLDSSIRLTTSNKYLSSLVTNNGDTIIGGYGSSDVGNGYFYKSSDGISFSQVGGALAGLQPTNIIYDSVANYFVAGGCYTDSNGCGTLTGGYSISNSTASTWATPIAIDSVNSMRGMTYGAGKIVGVTSGKGTSPFKSGYSAISTDGAVTWEASTQGELMPFYGIVYTDKYVAVGGAGSGESSGVIMTSIDGHTWDTVFNTNGILRSIAYQNGKYIAVGNAGKVFTSVDTMTWTAEDSTTDKLLNSITYGNNQFIATGSSGTVITSNGSGTWSVQNTGVTSVFNGVAYGGGQFVIVGAAGKIMTSANGVSWVDRVSGTSNTLLFVSYLDGKFIAGGTAGELFTSSNGTSWQPVSVGAGRTLRKLVKYKGVYYLSGDNGTFFKSTNKGSTWTPVLDNKFYNVTYVGLGG